jgi:hypothetical protein
MPFYIGTSDAITEYRPSCSIDEKIMKDNNLKTQSEYRAFIQKNGIKLMEQMKK